MKIIMNKFLVIPLAFILGGVSTYFVTDYIRLKSIESNDTVSKIEIPKAKQRSNKLLKARATNDPFSQMDKIHDQMRKRMDKVFENSMLGGSAFGGSFFDRSFFDSDLFGNVAFDDVKIEEHEDDRYKYIEILADGIDKNSLNITIEDGMVSISGEISKTDDNQSQNSRSVSSYVSKFSKSFSIPYGVDEDKVKIDAKDNKVVIKFPKEII